MKQGRKLEPAMETDGFLYGTGFLSDGASDSQSEISEMSSVEGRNTPRKFGTDLTERNVNKSSSKRLSSRFTKKQSSIVKHPRNRSRLQYNNISPLSKISPTIKSRFSSKERSNLGKNLAFSLEMAEKSVNSALNVGSTVKIAEQSRTPSSTNGTKSFWSSPIGQSSSPRAQEYSVYFKPGPIGLKLEPVIKNGTKEFGCRVMKFTEKKNKISSSPSQAVKCGLIQLGDVLTAINSISVTSKPYAEIISILTKYNDQGRTITFRWRSPAPVMPVTPGRSNLNHSLTQFSLKNNGATNEILKSPEISQQTKTPVVAKENVSTRLDFSQDESHSPLMFSPSSVQKLAKSNVKYSSDSSPYKENDKSGFLNSVIKRVFPDMYGSELKETAEKKYDLLSELSNVKVALTSEDWGTHNSSKQLQEKSYKTKDESENEATTFSVKNQISDNFDKDGEKSIDEIIDENARLKAECIYLQEIARKTEMEHCHEMNRFKSVLTFQSEATDILRLENERLDSLLKEQTGKFHDLVDGKKSLERSVSNLSASLKEKDTNLKQTEVLNCKRVAELEHRLRNSSEEQTNQLSKVQELEFQIENLQTSYAQSCDLISSLNKDLLNERTSNAHSRDSLIEERDAIKTQLEESKQIIAATTSELNEKLKIARSDIEARKDTEKQLIKQVSEREANFLCQIERLQGQFDEKSSMLKTTEENFDKVQHALFSTTEELNRVKLGCESTQMQLDRLNIEKEELLNKLKKSESESSDRQESAHLESEESNKLKEHLQICEQKILQLTETNTSLLKENENFKSRVSELQMFEAKFEELFERNKVLQKDYDSVCSDLQETNVLSAQLEQSNNLVQELEASNSILQKRCDELTLDAEDKGSLVMTLKTIKDEKEQLEKTHRDLQLKYDVVQSESQSLRHSLAETQRTANKRVQHLHEEMEKQRVASSQRESQLEMDIEESKLFIDNLMGQLKSGSRESSNLYEKKLLTMTNKLASMEEIISKTMNENQESSQEKERRITKLTDELSSMEAAVSTLKDDKSELTSIIASIEESKRHLSQSLQDQMERSVSLEIESSRLRSVEEEKNLLSSVVKERESEINALNTELSSLREREERKNEDIASLEGLITANGTDYHKNLAHIQGKLDRMALERNEALHSLHVSQLQIDLQCKTIEQLESCISHKKENDGALMATVLQLEEKLRKANVENQKKINVFKVEDKDKANLIETLKDEVKMKQQLIDTICAEREASLKDIDELQNALAKEKNALNMKESELQAALDHDVKLKEGLNLLQSQFQDSRYEVSELERALEDAESNCRSLTSSANNLSEKVLQLEGQLQSSSDEIKELTLLLSEKEMNHQSLESIVTDLQLRENESNDKLLKLETLLHASENNSKQLKQALKMKSIEFNDTMNQLNRSMAHQDELTLKNQKLEAQIEEYRFEISELEKVLDENNDDIEALRSRERVLQENLRKLDSQMVITRNDLEDLQKHSDQNNLSIKLNLVDEMKHLKDSLSVLTREKADSINILNEREIKLKELSISNQALMKENAELLESVNGFKSDLSMKESEIEQLEEVIVQQKHEMRNIRSDQSSTLNSLKESEIMTLQLEKELDAVKSAVEAERRKIIEVTKSNQILKESSESKKREIDDLLDTIEQFEVHVYELKESNESKQQEIDDLLDTVEQLDVHIQELTKSYDALKNTSREEAAAAKIHFEFEQKRSHQEVEEIKYAFQAQISSTREELKAALSEIQTLKDHSIKLETKLQDTETAFARQKESADTLTRTFEDDITEKQRHISNLNEELNIAQEKQLSSTMALSQKENELQETLKILDDIKNVSHSNETNLENLKKEIEKCCLDLNLIDEKRHPSSTLDFLCLLKNAVVDYKANAIAGFETANTRESAVNRLERMLAAKENEFDTLKNDNLALIHQLRESKEDLQQKFSDISMKEDKISELESAISQLELDFDMSEQLIEELRSEKEDIIKQLKKIEKESEVMTKSFTSASETIKELERKSVDSHRIHNSVLEEKNAHIQRLQHDIHSATIKAENLISAKEKLQSDILQLKQSYSQLELESQERFIAVQEELRDQIRRNDELHEDNCVLMSKLEDSLNSLEDLRACVALNEEEFSASIRNREAEIADLKKAMSALEDEANSKAERISELQNIERELSDEISKRTKIIRETEESKERIIISSKAEIEALNTQIKDLKSILSDDKAKDAKIDSLKATISSLNDEIKIKKSNIDSISKSRDSEVEILRKQIDTLHVKIQESQVEIQDHQFEKNLLQDSISSLQSDFQMKTQEITLLSQKYDTDVTSLQQELDDKSSQILCLSQKFDLIERTSQDLKSELDEALAKQQEFQIINADIEKAMQEATGLLKLRDETVLELRTENKHLEQKIGTLNGLPEKLEAKDTTISKISLEVQNLRAQHEELLKEIEHLKTALSSKDMDMIALNERAMKLETDLKTAESAVLCTAKENENGTEEYRLKIRELEDSYQDVSARLKGAEKIAMIQNKECTRLLNEIDSKTEQIIDLTKQLNSIETEREDYASRLSEIDSCMRAQKDLLTQMVKERDEHLSRISELELRFTSQKDLFLKLEKELQYKDQKIEKLESRRDSRMPSNAKIVELEEELARCNLQIYDLQTEVNQAHDECEELRSAIEKANAESATSEEEVQLLCESIEEKERLLNSLRLQLSSFAEEKQELQSHLNTVQIHLEKDSFSPLSTNSVDTKDVDEGQTSNFLSPSNSEVLSKHNELLDDLHRMKELIKDAISTPASNSSNSMPSPNQNQLLSSMEDQVDVLMKDIVDLKRNLSEKERLIHDLTMSLERSEKEKKEIETKLLNRKNYIKQLENALSHEVKHRRAAEEALLSTEAEKGNLALENEKQSEELQCAKLEIKAKSDAVQEQMKVARQMAKQLQITKKKIFALKKHLIENGLILPPEDIVSPTIESTKSYENSESNYSPIVTDLETRLNTVIPTTPPHDYSPIVTDENFRARAMDKTPIASNYTFSPIMTKIDISNDSLNWDALSSEDDEEHSY